MGLVWGVSKSPAVADYFREFMREHGTWPRFRIALAQMDAVRASKGMGVTDETA